MQIEFAQFIQNQLAPASFAEQYGLSHSTAFLRLQSGQRRITVDPAPVYLAGWMASPVCFELCKLARRNEFADRTEEYDPISIAEGILGAHSGSPWFEVEVGGTGFLNATPTSTFVLSYLELLATDGVRHLYCEDSRIVATHRPSESVPVPKAVDVEKLCAQLRNSNSAEEVLAFQRAILDRRACSWSEGMMLLALLRDSELDPEIFTRGLSGRQNIPWYFDRFAFVWERLLEENTFDVRHKASGHQNQAEMQNLIGNWILADASNQRIGDNLNCSLFQLIRRVLGSRAIVLRASRSGRPELLLEEVVELLRSFFALYNLPQCRAELMGSLEQAESREVHILLRLVCQGVGQVLSDLIVFLRELEFRTTS